MIFKYLLFVSLFLFFTSEVNANKKECQYWDLEEHLGSFYGHFTLPEHDWPENDEDMTRWCSDVKKEKKKVDQFLKNCTRGLGRTIASITVFSAAKLSKLACSNKNERAIYIEKGKCGNEGKEGTILCSTELINIISNIKLLPNPKDKIPSLCCSYYHYKPCVLNSYETIGEPICSRNNIDQLELQIERTNELAYATLCPNYKKPEMCQKYADMFNTTMNSNQYRTAFPAIIDILESL